MSLEQIILTQQDEPNQRNCIYKLKPVSPPANGESVENYTQIRVKSADFLQQDATAVYFYDFTNQFQALSLGSKLLEQEQHNHMLSIR